MSSLSYAFENILLRSGCEVERSDFSLIGDLYGDKDLPAIPRPAPLDESKMAFEVLKADL